MATRRLDEHPINVMMDDRRVTQKTIHQSKSGRQSVNQSAQKRHKLAMKENVCRNVPPYSRPKNVETDPVKTKPINVYKEKRTQNQACQTEEADPYENLLKPEATEKYWEGLAEERRKALEATLVENMQLHQKIDRLEVENGKLQKMADQAEHFASMLEELMPNDDSGIADRTSKNDLGEQEEAGDAHAEGSSDSSPTDAIQSPSTPRSTSATFDQSEDLPSSPAEVSGQSQGSGVSNASTECLAGNSSDGERMLDITGDSYDSEMSSTPRSRSATRERITWRPATSILEESPISPIMFRRRTSHGNITTSSPVQLTSVGGRTLAVGLVAMAVNFLLGVYFASVFY